MDEKPEKPARLLAVAFGLIVCGPIASAFLVPVAMLNPLKLPEPLGWGLLAASLFIAVSTSAIGGWLIGQVGGSKVAGVLIALVFAFFGFILWVFAQYPALYLMAPSPANTENHRDDDTLLSPASLC